MTSKAFVGRFDMDLQFTQTQKVEIQLTHLKAKLNNEQIEDDHHERKAGLQFAY